MSYYNSSIDKDAEKYGVPGTNTMMSVQRGTDDEFRSEHNVKNDIAKAANNDYDNRKFLEVVGSPGFKEKMKEEGNWNKDINKAWKVAAGGNGIVSYEQLKNVEKGFSELGNVLDTHNNRGEFDSRDQAGTLNAALAEYMDIFSLKDAVIKNKKDKKKDKGDKEPNWTQTEMENLGMAIDNVIAFEEGRRGAREESFDVRDDEQKRSSMDFANDFKKDIIGRGRQSRFAV